VITFGLTGGICCGKSTVSKTFIQAGIPMVDADLVAREVVTPGSYGLQQLVNAFNIFGDILQEDGALARSKLAEIVFHHDPLQRQLHLNTLNSIMGPLIHEAASAHIRKLHSHGYPIVGWDAALIVESGNIEKFRPLIVVSCPPEMQLVRLMARNSLTREQAMIRIESQLSTKEKVKVADYVIDTSNSIEGSIRQTKIIIDKFNVTG
jgi:dephospho-CoA kinase